MIQVRSYRGVTHRQLVIWISSTTKKSHCAMPDLASRHDLYDLQPIAGCQHTSVELGWRHRLAIVLYDDTAWQQSPALQEFLQAAGQFTTYLAAIGNHIS